MNPFDSAFANRLAVKVKETHDTKAEHVLSGVYDQAQYKEAAGYLRALGDVGIWMHEIETELNQGK